MTGFQLLRHYAIRRDNEGHALREAAFIRWCNDYLMAQAVNRWIREIGEASRANY